METIITDNKFLKIWQDYWSLKLKIKDLKDQQQYLLWVEINNKGQKLVKSLAKDMGSYTFQPDNY
jgi:hypothetical protein